MADSRSQRKKRKLYALSRAAEKWKELKACADEERKQALNQRALIFHLDDVGAGWEYVHFSLDGRTVDSFRISYIGPDVRSFVSAVSSLKEEDCAEVVFCDEPGEYFLVFARKMDVLYIELPGMKKGVFQEYAVFRDRILQEERKYYG